MKRALLILAILVAVLVSIPLGWLGFHALRLKLDKVHESWNQKMVLTIDRPEGALRASVVQHIEWWGWKGETRKWVEKLDGAHTSWKVTGEALVAEIAPGKYLFALLKGPGGFIGDPGMNLGYALLETTGTRGYISTPETIALITSLPPGQTVLLPADAWPLMVTFDDITDPTTVRRVDPHDLDATFGCDRGLTPAEAPWRAEGRTWANWAAEAAYRQASAQAAVNAAIPIEDIDAMVEFSWLTGRLHSWQPGDDEKRAAARARISQEEYDRWEKEIRALNWGRDVVLPTPVEIAAKTGGPCYQLKAVTLELTDEPVTDGSVEGVMGDLEQIGRNVDPATRVQYPPGLAAELIPSNAKYFDVTSFKTGLYK